MKNGSLRASFAADRRMKSTTFTEIPAPMQKTIDKSGKIVYNRWVNPKKPFHGTTADAENGE